MENAHRIGDSYASTAKAISSTNGVGTTMPMSDGVISTQTSGFENYLADLTMRDNYRWQLRKITTKDIEENERKIIQFGSAGFNKENLFVDSLFKNKTKETSLRIHGSRIDEVTFEEKVIDMKIPIDTSIYNKWTYRIESGLLTIILFEIINEKPKFEYIEKQERGTK